MKDAPHLIAQSRSPWRNTKALDLKAAAGVMAGADAVVAAVTWVTIAGPSAQQSQSKSLW